ncbi:MAG: SdpI family protein [Oscillospiraceae bacterium]
MIGFYVFMLICVLLIPVTMLFFGYRWQRKPPKEINMGYGYRTRRSMSSHKAWIFAHIYFGKLWVKFGWATLAVTFAAMVPLALFTLKIDTVGAVGGVIVFLQLLLMIMPIFQTEQALKREFGI